MTNTIDIFAVTKGQTIKTRPATYKTRQAIIEVDSVDYAQTLASGTRSIVVTGRKIYNPGTDRMYWGLPQGWVLSDKEAIELVEIEGN